VTTLRPNRHNGIIIDIAARASDQGKILWHVRLDDTDECIWVAVEIEGLEGAVTSRTGVKKTCAATLSAVTMQEKERADLIVGVLEQLHDMSVNQCKEVQGNSTTVGHGVSLGPMVVGTYYVRKNDERQVARVKSVVASTVMVTLELPNESTMETSLTDLRKLWVLRRECQCEADWKFAEAFAKVQADLLAGWALAKAAGFPTPVDIVEKLQACLATVPLADPERVRVFLREASFTDDTITVYVAYCIQFGQFVVVACMSLVKDGEWIDDVWTAKEPWLLLDGVYLMNHTTASTAPARAVIGHLVSTITSEHGEKISGEHVWAVVKNGNTSKTDAQCNDAKDLLRRVGFRSASRKKGHSSIPVEYGENLYTMATAAPLKMIESPKMFDCFTFDPGTVAQIMVTGNGRKYYRRASSSEFEFHGTWATTGPKRQKIVLEGVPRQAWRDLEDAAKKTRATQVGPVPAGARGSSTEGGMCTWDAIVLAIRLWCPMKGPAEAEKVLNEYSGVCMANLLVNRAAKLANEGEHGYVVTKVKFGVADEESGLAFLLTPGSTQTGVFVGVPVGHDGAKHHAIVVARGVVWDGPSEWPLKMETFEEMLGNGQRCRGVQALHEVKVRRRW
jgi:hypothetical protein